MCVVSLRSRALVLAAGGGTSWMLAAALTPDDAGILKDKDLKSTCTARAWAGARAKRKKEFFVLPLSL